MTSPDLFGLSQMPYGAVTISNFSSQQSVTQSNVAQAAMQPVITGVNDLFDNIINGILGGFGNVVDAVVAGINQFIADLVYGLKNATGGLIDLTGFIHDVSNTANTANAAAGNAQTTANSAQSNSTANAAAIAGLQATSNSSTTGGASVFDNFTTVGALSGYSTWTVGGPSLGLTLYVGSSGDLGLTGTPTANGPLWALNNTFMLTDGMQATLVSENQGNQDASTSIIIRASSTMSHFVYANIFGNNGTTYIGYGTWNGTSYTFTDWAHVSVQQNAGQTWTLSALGNVYKVQCNGVTVLSYTDTLGNAPTGSAYRFVGLMDSTNADFFGQHYGWQITSFSASDISAPTVVGIGWSFQRASTSSVTGTSTAGWNPLPSSTYDTNNGYNNVILTSLGSGIVTIKTAGFYALYTAIEFSSGSGTGDATVGFLYSPSGGSPVYVGAGWANIASGQTILSMQTAHVQYMNQGDTIQPALYTTGSGLPIVGGGNYMTRFSGYLGSGA